VEKKLVTACCVCRRIKDSSGEWIEISPEEYELLDALRVTHGFCPPDLEAAMAAVEFGG